MRPLLASLLLLTAFSAQATDTVAFGNRVLVTGDGTGRVLQLAGQPDRKERLENDRGALLGERWEYYRKDKTIQITVRNGVVTEIQEIR